MSISAAAVAASWVVPADLAAPLLEAPGDDGAPAPQPGADERAAALGGRVDLARLLDLAAARAGVRVEYDEQVVRGQVTLRAPVGVPESELWSLVNRLLAARGLTTVKMPGDVTYGVVKVSDAAAIAEVDLSRLGDAASEDISAGDAAPGDARPVGAPVEPGFAAWAIRVRHQSGKEAADWLKPLLSRSGSSITVMETGAGAPGGGDVIVIADLTPRLRSAEAALALFDRPSAPAAMFEAPLEHVAPAPMAAMAKQVMTLRRGAGDGGVAGEVIPSPTGRGVLVVCPERDAAAWRELIAALDRRESVGRTSYTPRAFPAADVARLVEQTVRDLAPGDDRWKVVVDDLTGTLIITATPTQHAAIADLLSRLDATPQSDRRPVRAIAVRHRAAAELVGVLERFSGQGLLDAMDSAPAGEPSATPARGAADRSPAPASGSPATGGAAEGGPTAGGPAAVRTGSGGPEGSAGGAAGEIGQPGGAEPLRLSFDESTNTILAVGDPRMLEQVERVVARLDVPQPQVMLEVVMVSLTDAQTLELGVELEKLELDGGTVARLSSLFGLSTRGATGPISAGGAGLTGVVLSPGDYSVVVRAIETVNGGRSLSRPRLLAGNNQAATLSSVLEQPYATTSDTNTSTTTGFGGAAQAGTQVTVTPRIVAGGRVDLRYQVSLSSFTGAASAATLPPPRQENSLTSAATAPDGHTVVVGGIEVRADSAGRSMVPGLARVPILGELFQSRSRAGTRTRFYVFIRADVLRSGSLDDLRHLSADAAASMGVDEGRPRVRPAVMR